jgi:hypothetical protein
MGFFKKAAVATAMATAVVCMVGQGGAFAAPVGDYVGVAGTGTISPGLPTTGCAVQTGITFSGTGAVVGTDGVAAPATINFDGNSGSTCETLNSGQGSGTLSGSLTGTVSYQRTGAIVQVFGNVSVLGSPSRSPLVAVCVFAATTVNPVTTYVLVCASVL